MEEEAYVQNAQPASMYVGPGRFSRNRLTEKLFYSDDFGFVKIVETFNYIEREENDDYLVDESENEIPL